jgi:hypothetical protein
MERCCNRASYSAAYFCVGYAIADPDADIKLDPEEDEDIYAEYEKHMDDSDAEDSDVEEVGVPTGRRVKTSVRSSTAPMDQPLTDIADEAGDRLARAAGDDVAVVDPTLAGRRAKIDAFAATVNAAKRTNFDITDIHAVTDKHGVHPSVWAGRDANMDDFVVKQDGEGRFDKVIRTRDLGTLVVTFQQIWRQCNEWLV